LPQRGQGWGTATIAAEVAASAELAGPDAELIAEGAEDFLDRIDVIQFEFGGCNIDTAPISRTFGTS
jgi:hypothetical protein